MKTDLRVVLVISDPALGEPGEDFLITTERSRLLSMALLEQGYDLVRSEEHTSELQSH